MAGDSATYPKRPQFFAHKFCRLMTKACAAQEIGPEGALLCMVVVHQEDAKQYRGPVTYYNEQLGPLCGLGSRARLVRARDKAIEAGWLHYEPGGKSKPGKYWVTIPGHASGMPDSPMDESEDPIYEQRSSNETERQTDSKRTLNGLQTDSKRTLNAHLSTLTLDPYPDPKKEPPYPPQEKSHSEAMAGQPPIELDFLSRWNSTPGVKPYHRSELSYIRRRELLERLADPNWNWHAALDRFPLQCARGHPEDWKPTVGWFLKEDSVENVLEGKYDFEKSRPKQTGNRLGPGQVYDPNAEQKDPKHGQW